MVDRLIVKDGSNISWTLHTLTSLWPDEIVQRIIQIPLGVVNVRCWKSEPSGTCSFKTSFKEIQGLSNGPPTALEAIMEAATSIQAPFFFFPEMSP